MKRSIVMEKSTLIAGRQWEEISSRARAILNYSIVQKEVLEKNKTARFIAAIPFLGECAKPVETAFSHLLIYLVSLDESAKDIYFHKAEDDHDLYSRIRPLLNFIGGNEDILNCCRDLLSLCMVSNYIHNAEADNSIGKYNPVAAGIWDGKAIQQKLITSIEETITPEIAAYYTIDDAIRGFWEA
jgi:hypothetical protein